MDDKIKDLQGLRVNRHKVRVWRPFMEKYNCEIIAELGVCEGNNFRSFTEHGPKLAVGVDIWKRDGVPSRNDRDYSQEDLDLQYEKMAASPEPFVRIYREYTFDAVKHFPDEYFDLVYIDADHTYDSVLRDTRDWYPKVKKGGVLCGDDYRVLTVRWTHTKFGVIEAVKTFTDEMKLDFFEFPRRGWAIIKL